VKKYTLWLIVCPFFAFSMDKSDYFSNVVNPENISRADQPCLIITTETRLSTEYLIHAPALSAEALEDIVTAAKCVSEIEFSETHGSWAILHFRHPFSIDTIKKYFVSHREIKRIVGGETLIGKYITALTNPSDDDSQTTEPDFPNFSQILEPKLNIIGCRPPAAN
jgi:hypothetical protein